MKHMAYDLTRHIDCVDPKRYQQLLKQQAGTLFRGQELKENMDRFRSLCTEEENLIGFGNDRLAKILNEFLPKLPKLYHIGLSTRYTRPHPGHVLPPLKPYAMIPRGTAQFDGDRPFRTIFQETYLAKVPVSVLSIDV